MSLKDLLAFFPVETQDASVCATTIDVATNEYELPIHQHATGQLILTLRGNVTCRVSDSIWLVPPQSAVWVPPNVPHCIRVSAHSSICLLFVSEALAQLPPHCCALSITPLVRELICHIATLSEEKLREVHSKNLIRVLLEELSSMPVIRLCLPISMDSRIRMIAEAILDSPSKKMTLSDWAKYIGMSRRSLARLVSRETGLSFGRWRLQLLLMIAIQKLSEGNSVQQTAWALGYESVTAFITMFKKALGTSPARYVQQ